MPAAQLDSIQQAPTPGSGWRLGLGHPPACLSRPQNPYDRGVLQNIRFTCFRPIPPSMLRLQFRPPPLPPRCCVAGQRCAAYLCTRLQPQCGSVSCI